MRKKVRRLKRKYFKSLFVIILLVIVATLCFVFKDKFVFNDITNSSISYKDCYKTTSDTDLYNSDNKVIGKISKNSHIFIDKKNGNYYKLKDLDSYILSDKVKKTKINKINNNYVSIDKDIVTKENVTLSSDDSNITFTDSNTFNVLYFDNENYYILLFDNIYKINKNDVTDIKDSENVTKDKISESISVINFNSISESCIGLYECSEVNKVEEYIKILNKNNYYLINLDEFINWNFKFSKLKKGAVLLTSSDKSSIVDELNKKYDNKINIIDGNSKFTFTHVGKSNNVMTNLSSINNYNVRSNTSNEDFISMVKGEEVKDKFEGEFATSVPVLNYHFFFDSTKGQVCNESICIDTVLFRKHLDYLRDNGFYTVTMSQFIDWIYGKIELPKKSVLITIDDGAYGTGFHNDNNLMPILEEYKMHATLFLITGWWDINNYKSSYLEVQSHTNDMHTRLSGGNVQLVAYNYDQVKSDLQKSIDVIGNNNSFCYPFYMYDDEAIQAIKDLGFKVAFAGGNKKATRNSNKYIVPRYPIYNTTSVNSLSNMVN